MLLRHLPSEVAQVLDEAGARILALLVVALGAGLPRGGR
jgi:hypothetical protein